MSQSSTGQSSPITVNVPGASYSIRIEEGLLEKAGEALESLLASRKVYILSDTTVWKLWGTKLLRSFKRHRPAVILISAYPPIAPFAV